MSLLTKPRYNLPEAVEAAGITAKQARNWAAKGGIQLYTDTEAGKWRKVSGLDSFLLAVTGRLVGYGMPVKDSWNAAGTVVSFLLNGLGTAEGDDKLSIDEVIANRYESIDVAYALKRLDDQVLTVTSNKGTFEFLCVSSNRVRPDKSSDPHLLFLKLRPLFVEVTDALFLA